ncbi:hypothetical protein IWW36_005799, partial [Coemansia brasiliensis]
MDPELTPAVLEELRKDPLKAALTATSLSKFYMAKQFPDNTAQLTSVDFDPAGSRCITTSYDESLRIYDCMQGKRVKVSYSKKYGCNLAQFTSQPGSVAYASTKINDTIRYLSYETNQFIRYFVGHKDMVTSLQRSPIDDPQQVASLVSASMDGTVRLWNLEDVRPASTVEVDSKEGVLAAYDPSGMIVAVCVASRELQLYDTRKMSKGPFISTPLSFDQVVVGLKFLPPTGDYILLVMANMSIEVLDAFQLKPRAVLSTEAVSHAAGSKEPVLKQMQQECFGQKVTTTPDGRAVIAGCNNGTIAFWDMDAVLARISYGSASKIICEPDGTWNESHDGPVGICAFNPMLMQCVTGA